MTILVTGSAGHLGEALVRVLRSRNEDVRSLDVKPSDFTSHIGSVTDRAAVRTAVGDATAVIHAATLHKPHVETHSRQDFVDVNVSGTLNLLEEAAAAGVGAFVFVSTTSVFGDAMSPADGEPAVWVTEDVVPQPRNIYGVTKLAAENLCGLIHRLHGLPTLVLRTSRFFLEEDDSREIREQFSSENARANELAYRRVDIEDVVEACLLALRRAPAIGHGRYIVSATTPFLPEDAADLRHDAHSVLSRRAPGAADVYAARGWRMFPGIDRIYDNARARRELGWSPRHDAAAVMARLSAGGAVESELARAVGSKGYHDRSFADGPYPVAGDGGRR